MKTALVAGSYERFLFGFEASEAEEAGSSGAVALRRSFTYAAHKGPVKCVDRQGPFLVSGGADDLIHLYDLKAGKDLGLLMNPCDGAVTCLQLHTPEGRTAPSHLLSGSQDGGITVWKSGTWQALKTMRGHTKEVHGLAVHASGAVALSVSHDVSMKMWNLVTGKASYTTRLEQESHAVAFDPTSQNYALLCSSLLSVHSAGRADGPVTTLRVPRKALCMAWQGPHTLLAGCDDGSLRLFDVRQAAGGGKPAWCLEKAHKVRVKGVCLVHTADGASLPPTGAAIGTVSNDGLVKVWDERKLAAASAAPTPLGEASTGARFTCLAGMRLRAAGDSTAAPPAASAQQDRAPRQRGAAAAAAAGAIASSSPGQQQGVQQQQQQQQRQEHRGGGGRGRGDGGGRGRGGGGGRGTGDEKRKKNKAAVVAGGGGQAMEEDGVVVRDGVVEFVDDPREVQRAKQQLKNKQKKRQRQGK